MAFSINSNIASLKAQLQLSRASDRLSRNFERLSSGLRINRGSDDAAGLAISSTLRADARVFAQGMRNISDGVSLMGVAEGALREQTNILMRLKELATQSTNGSYSITQRQALGIEATQLTHEYNRINHSTKFNGIGIINLDIGIMHLQAGYSQLGLEIGLETGRTIGSGTFSGAVSVTAGGELGYAIELADVNADGILDMVTSGKTTDIGVSGNPEFSVALGNGNGTFKARVSYQLSATSGTQETASELLLADMNNDGKLDVITAGRIGNNRGVVMISLGNGDAQGTFAAPVSTVIYTTFGETKDIAIGDLNNDGFKDVVFAGELPNGVAQLRILSGNGSGALSLSTATYNLGSTVTSNVEKVFLRDSNQDGSLDIITSGINDSGSHESNTLFGAGNGTFSGRISSSIASNNSSVADLADLNQDGYLDLVTGSGSGIFVQLGQAGGTFRSAVSYQVGDLSGISALRLADINGDGRHDLIFAGGAGGNDSTLSVALGNGNGSFAAASTYYQSSQTLSAIDIALGDLNGDGAVDMATTAIQGGQIYSLAATAQSTDLQYLNLASRDEALQALDQIDTALSRISRELGSIGAFQSRLLAAMNNLGATRDNYIQAGSRITDADIGQESADLLREQILQQTASAVLAQANLIPDLALLLLKG
ncbi:MAG: hypothetical protein DCC75_01725 [Proteobacteria bacterium]|nr:MAG: hypothetical protein DCC75_01725 [Pseudomonadota bacterium]